MDKETPCYCCTERTATCHTTCEKYLEFYRKHRERENARLYAPGRTDAHVKRVRRALLNIRKSMRRKRHQ